jgi:hypothetical protein
MNILIIIGIIAAIALWSTFITHYKRASYVEITHETEWSDISKYLNPSIIPTPLPKHQVGDILNVIACNWGHQLKIGDTVEVMGIDNNGFNSTPTYMYVCSLLGDPSNVWFFGDDELDPAGPSIPISQVAVLPSP